MPKNDIEDAHGVAYLKLCCKLLSAQGVKEVVFEYDGSGDSGDFSDTYVLLGPDAHAKGRCVAGIGTPSEQSMSAVTNAKRMNWDDFTHSVGKEADKLIAEGKSPLMTSAMCDKILDAAFDTLPGGWEINDGSYGTIRIDVTKERIDVEHNERYTDVRTDNFSY